MQWVAVTSNFENAPQDGRLSMKFNSQDLAQSLTLVITVFRCLWQCSLNDSIATNMLPFFPPL